MAFITSSLPVTCVTKSIATKSICNTSSSSSIISKQSKFTPCFLPSKNNQQRHGNSNSINMLVVESKSTKDMDTIIENAEDSLIVIDYSTSWCGPCKIFAPIFEELSEKYNDVVFVKVMGDSSPDASELMRREGIRAVPAFHFWKNKKRVRDITGARKEDVEVAICELVGKAEAS